MPVREIREGYFVSSDGRVFSKKRELKQFRTGYNPGYMTVNLSYEKNVKVHHLVLEAFVGPKPSPQHEARHLDGNADNNDVSNLVWGTSTENKLDRLTHAGGGPVLTLVQVAEIKELLAAGELSQRKIAALYGINQSNVSRINTAERWATRACA